MQINSISIKDLEIQFVANKENAYKTMMYYFKIVDYQQVKKLRLFNKVSKSLLKPIWNNDNGEAMLKVKASCIEKLALETNKRFNVEVVFVGYSDPKNKEEVKGYYARVINMKYLDDESDKGSDKCVLGDSD